VNVKFASAYSLYRFFPGGKYLVTLTTGRVSRCKQRRLPRRVACNVEHSSDQSSVHTRKRAHLSRVSAHLSRPALYFIRERRAVCMPRMYAGITRGQKDGRHASRSYIWEDGREFPREARGIANISARGFASSAKTECGLNVASTCLRSALRHSASRALLMERALDGGREEEEGED